MYKYYQLMSGDKYAKYYTKESLDYDDTLGYQSFEEIYDRGQIYLAENINPIGVKWNQSFSGCDNEKRLQALFKGELAIYDKNEPWNPPILREDKLGKKRGKRKGDIHSVYSHYNTLLFSQKAVDRLGDILEQYGVLLPFDVEDRDDKLYRYWVTNELPFDAINLEKSMTFELFELKMKEEMEEMGFDISYNKDDYIVKNKATSLYSLVLKKKYEENVSMIFKISDVKDNGIFVTEEFIELVKKHKLKGFMFCENSSPSSSSKCIEV